MSDCRRILVIRLSSIGDILFTLPAVNVLRDNFPDSKITYLTRKVNAPLLGGFAAVDAVQELDHDLFHTRDFFRILPYTGQLWRRLRRERFDLVVDFHGIAESGLMGRLVQAPKRWGIRRKEAIRGRMYTFSAPPAASHPVDINLELLRKAGLSAGTLNNRFHLPPEALTEAKKLYWEWGLTEDRPLVFIQPFTNHLNKNWPLDYYLKYAAFLTGQGIQVVFGGGPSDRKKLERAASTYPVAAGKADLLTSGGLMSLSNLVVGGDTGMLHLATALGKRVVMLIRASDQNRFYPYGHQDWIITPIPNSDVASIPVAQLITATMQSWTEVPWNSNPDC
jgi:ADP-heptose:LPS heptosyltransferase